MRQPVTYLEIQKWVYRRHGFIPKTCWIAHCKELCGLPLGVLLRGLEKKGYLGSWDERDGKSGRKMFRALIEGK